MEDEQRLHEFSKIRALVYESVIHHAEMKRKNWTEEEEETLITKYSEMLDSGQLAKLRTREKKFMPIAAHVNATHHSRDSSTFPWEWTWRDVSIKIQNMRHQYMGVKHKIRKKTKKTKRTMIENGGSCDNDDDCFDWEDGVNHWQNFLRYKQVFGDVDLDEKPEILAMNSDISNREDEDDHHHRTFRRRLKKRRKDGSWKTRFLGCLGIQLLEIRDFMMKREGSEKEGFESREERERRMRKEEKREEEEMEWRERMMTMQIEHEKQMMQIQADVCHNQMQMMGVMVRALYQMFAVGGDALGGLNPVHSHVLQAMHHHGSMVSGSEKPEANSASDFIGDD